MVDNTDKRNSFRRKTIFGGVLFDDGGRNWECSVSDISKTGVKVRVKSVALQVDDEIELKINKFNDLRRCRISWNRGNEYGLSFLVAISEKDGEMSRLFDFAPGNV